MRFRDKLVMFLATGGFVGYIPMAPGTFGSVVAIRICYAFSRINLTLAVSGMLVLISIAIWIAQAAESIMAKTDPGIIVIDEIAGMAVTLIGVPFQLTSVLGGFFVFRALDIAKPFPIRVLERRLPGGTGVVLDDVMAGIYSNLLVRLILYFFNID